MYFFNRYYTLIVTLSGGGWGVVVCVSFFLASSVIDRQSSPYKAAGGERGDTQDPPAVSPGTIRSLCHLLGSFRGRRASPLPEARLSMKLGGGDGDNDNTTKQKQLHKSKDDIFLS